MGKFQERKITSVSRNQGNITAEYLFNPVTIQQIKKKIHLGQLLDGLALMDDFNGDIKNLHNVFDHLNNKGIDCAEFFNRLEHLELKNKFTNYFFSSSCQNGNIDE